MAKNVPNLVKETDIQVQQAQRVPNKMNPRRFMPRDIIIKMSKVKGKEGILSSKRKTTNYRQGNPHKNISWFFSRNFVVQKEMAWCSNMLKGKNFQQRRKEIIKVRWEILNKWNGDKKKINETESWFCEKINKNNKPLARFNKKKRD